MHFNRCAAAAWILGILMITGTIVRADSAPNATRPNIVILLADDMGFSDIGCYGGEIQTPNIDHLAAGGVRFTQFYNTARCCPTRASLLTGLYPHQAGMGWMTRRTNPAPGYQGDLSDHAVTIAQVLRAAGYATYMCGKWHVTRNAGVNSPKNNWPMQRGFDRFYGTVKGGGSYYDPAMLTRGNTPISPLADPEYKPAHFYYTDAIADQSARFIREHQGKSSGQPFFLYVAFTSPHWPLNAPEETIAKYKGKYDAGYAAIRQARFERQKAMGLIDSNWALSVAPAKWADVKHKKWEARCMEVYAAQVDRMDQGIGKIIAALKESGQLDNTLVLFLADNGGCAETQGRTSKPNPRPAVHLKPTDPQPDVHPRLTRDGRPMRDGTGTMPGPEGTFIAYGQHWANVSNTPFREYKHWVHEGGISTPLIAYWPAGLPRHGEWERQPGHVIDLMATCVALSGAKYPSQNNGHAITPMQGVSLLPAFLGKPLDRKRPIFWEHEGNRAEREGKWKLVATGQDSPWELYDMQADRTEMHDLAKSEPQRVKTMSQKWWDWAKKSDVLPLGGWKRKPATHPAQPPKQSAANESIEPGNG